MNPETTENKVDPNLNQNKSDTNSQQVDNISPENEANWKAFREQKEQERKARIEAEKRAQEKQLEAEALKQALEAALNKGQYAQPQQQQNYYAQEEETEDQRIKNLVKAELEAERIKIKKEQAEYEQKTYQQRILDNHKDFNNICSDENMDYLQFHHPEICKGFRHMPEGFEKWDTIYKAIRKYVPNTEAKKDLIRAERNLNKPQSIASTTTPTGSSGPFASQISEDKKAANWARMQRSLKGLSTE